MEVPTVEVKAPAGSRNETIRINEEDFNPEVHKLVGKPTANLVVKFGEKAFPASKATTVEKAAETTPAAPAAETTPAAPAAKK